jgi:predicted cupin superfamily sugar epimerase
MLRSDGSGEVFTLGSDLSAGQRPQLVVPQGVWQGSRLKPGGQFALMGTTMSPGWDPADFELGQREVLQREFPKFRELVEMLTR